MRRISFMKSVVLLIGVAACGGGGTAAGTPAVGPSPSAAPAAQTGRGGGTGGRGSVVDTTRYVRTTPATDPVIRAMYEEGMHHSQTEPLSQLLFDSIGPRLTNSDRYNAGQDWLVKTYASWGIPARKEQWGTWSSWRRGPTHLDLIAPRTRSLEAMMLAWSPGTEGRDIEGDVVLLPDAKTPEDFSGVAGSLRGKFVLVSPPNPSCRMPSQWKEFGQPGAWERDSTLRAEWARAWQTRIEAAGGRANQYAWPKQVGVAGVISTNWSQYPGIDKVFGSAKQQVPTIDVTCEDYNLLYRLADRRQGPRVRLNAGAEFLGEQPVNNVIAEIRGSTLPNEYIVLSAHYDSWDGGSGATDNGTGTITMLEGLRILKKLYPNPRRTIIVGHWGGEEQGLNGSHAYVEDHPDVVKGVYAGWNQDNGTGRIINIGPGPFTAASDRLVSYLREIPPDISGWIKMSGISPPAGGGTDNASFQCAQSPVYGLGALGWDYSWTTWHTNRDTYDKIVFEDLKNNATLVAMLTYLADKDPSPLSHQAAASATNFRGESVAVTFNCPKAVRSTAASSR
jgi:carboxypeptidase Q